MSIDLCANVSGESQYLCINLNDVLVYTYERKKSKLWIKIEVKWNDITLTLMITLGSRLTIFIFYISHNNPCPSSLIFIHVSFKKNNSFAPTYI